MITNTSRDSKEKLKNENVEITKMIEKEDLERLISKTMTLFN